jgi:hypothetical protein
MFFFLIFTQTQLLMQKKIEHGIVFQEIGRILAKIVIKTLTSVANIK